jgi:hypothetical protein
MAVSAPSRIEELRHKGNSLRFAFVLLSQFALIAAYPLAKWKGLAPVYSG